MTETGSHEGEAIGGQLVPVAFAGDWQGNISWVAKAIPALRRAVIHRLYHVGDVGIWPVDAAFIDAEY